MDELYDLVLKRRSTRKFKDEKISEEKLNKILSIALTAPSSWGGHPVEFILVQDKQMINDIAHCKAMGAVPLHTASAAIVVMADIDDCELWIEDASVASTYILLAAQQYDIGACWIHIRNRNGQYKSADEEIRDLLHVPDNYRILNVVALGIKDENKKARTPNNLPHMNIHNEYYKKGVKL